MSFEIHLSPPHLTGKEQEFLKAAFDANWIGPLGPNLEAFEKEMAAYLGSDLHAAAVSSGTAAIHLALEVLGVGSGDQVLCSDLTFIASASPIFYCGAEPVFVDCDPTTWNMSVPALKRALEALKKAGRRPKAAIVVDIYGQSADLDPIVSLCREHGVPVVEDAAEALGATYRGRKCGSLGDISILSFNGNKIITTSTGGMLISRNEDWIRRAHFLATQARDPGRHYQHSVVGYNYRMSNLLAGIGRAQLAVLDERVEQRRQVYRRYEEALGNLAGIAFMPETDFGSSTRWLTVMTLDPKLTAVTPTDIAEHFEKRRVESRPVWKPLHLQPALREFAFYSHLPEGSVAESLFQTGICLPSGSSLTKTEQQLIIDEVTRLVGNTSSTTRRTVSRPLG